MTGKEMLLYNSLKGLYLLDKADTHRVVSDLMGLQAQFANYPKASLRIRASDYHEADPFAGLVKIWSHRGTMHLVPEDELGLHLSAYDNAGPFVHGYWGISQADAEYWAPFIEEQIGKGNNSRDGLKAACADKGMGEELLHQVFYGWGGLIREMVCRGRIVCGTGTQKAYFLPKPVQWMDRDQARRVFLRRYFQHYGPATLSDCRYFFSNWKKSDMDPLLQELLPELCCTSIDSKQYYSLHEPIRDGENPAYVLVPGFDQLVLGYRDRERMIGQLLELVHLSDRADDYVDNLSRGMKQRLCLAHSLIHDPKLLILDEPASGMDPRARAEMKSILRTLKEMGKSVLISSHILPELSEMCDSLTILDHGQLIFSGSVTALSDRMNGRNPLEIRLQEDSDTKNVETLVTILRENPLVEEITQEEPRLLRVRMGGKEEDLSALLQLLIMRGIPVCDFHRASMNLEKVFMEVTQDA